jgi:hypothetical protein
MLDHVAALLQPTEAAGYIMVRASMVHEMIMDRFHNAGLQEIIFIMGLVFATGMVLGMTAACLACLLYHSKNTQQIQLQIKPEINIHNPKHQPANTVKPMMTSDEKDKELIRLESNAIEEALKINFNYDLYKVCRIFKAAMGKDKVKQFMVDEIMQKTEVNSHTMNYLLYLSTTYQEKIPPAAWLLEREAQQWIDVMQANTGDCKRYSFRSVASKMNEIWSRQQM